MKALWYVLGAITGLVIGAFVAWLTIPLIGPGMGVDRMWQWVDVGALAGIVAGLAVARRLLRRRAASTRQQ